MLQIPSWIADGLSRFPRTNRAEGCPTTDCTWSLVCPGSTATIPTQIWSRRAHRWGRCCAAALTDGMRRRLRYFHIASITTVWSGDIDEGVLLGVEETELRPVAIDFTQQLHLLIIGDSECGKTAALRTVCRELLRTTNPEQCQLFIVDVRRSLLDVVEPRVRTARWLLRVRGCGRPSNSTPDRTSCVDECPRRTRPPAQLRSRSWWSGPEIYVVVDDYESDGRAIRWLLSRRCCRTPGTWVCICWSHAEVAVRPARCSSRCSPGCATPVV